VLKLFTSTVTSLTPGALQLISHNRDQSILNYCITTTDNQLKSMLTNTHACLFGV